MTKQQEIDALLAKPIEVGSEVTVRIVYTKTKSVTQGRGKKSIIVEEKTEYKKNGYGKVSEIINDPALGTLFVVKDTSSSWSVPYEVQIDENKLKTKPNLSGHNYNLCRAEWVQHDTSHCGANPFKRVERINFAQQTVWQLLFNSGYGRSDEFSQPEYKTIAAGGSAADADLVGCTHGGMNFDPYVIDKDGNRQYYQRGLVWNLEQKQLLVESMYNGIEIGKFIFRYRSWPYIRKQMLETGHGHDWDCVDGKQRMHAIIGFVGNTFKDMRGNYFRDLSESARRKFLDYGHLAIGTLAENSTDQQAISAFLTLNFTGTPMSKEHIAHVQSIKI